MHQIHPNLLQMAVDMVGLVPDPRNARSHDERNIAEIVKSYKAHGQRKPIVVQMEADDGTKMVVRAGNGQVEAARRLGWDQIAALVIDENDRDAIAYALRDNRTAELAGWDLPALGENMTYLTEHGLPISEVGWEPYEAAPFMDAEWKPPANTGEDFDTPEKFESLKFNEAQWATIKGIVGTKPTADLLMAWVEKHA